MSEELSKVHLVLPVIPGEPMVAIDGQALKGVLGAQVEHKPDAGTILHLTLLAEITCETMPLPTAGDEPEDEWETLGEMKTLADGEVVYQRHRETGDTRKVKREQSCS